MQHTADIKDRDIKFRSWKPIDLITYVHVEPAHHNDAHRLIPAIESVEKRNLKPQELLADSLYGSDENCEHAKEHTPAFMERYRLRAGIEATMSKYKRRTGVKRLRVRGLEAVRYCAILYDFLRDHQL